MLSSCVVADKYPRNPLVDQILKPRQGHPGLTNRACVSWDDKGNCLNWEIKDYSLDDKTFRETANKLGFICNVGGRRTKICMDKPGFCRISYSKKGCGIFCTKTVRNEEYIPASPIQFHLDANTKCFNKDTYPFE